MVERFPEGPVTILFSDVEGSTDLRTGRGDAVAHRILRSHEEVVRRCVGAQEGREVKALGDGFMVAFASVRRALACAISIQQGLEDRNAEAPGDEVRVRIGINTGEVVVEGDDMYGQAVNAAARIASRAKGGEILVSEIVRQLAGSGPEFTFADRGRYRLKGFPDRWHLYGVVYEAARPTESGSSFADRTPFVGREAERAELRPFIAQTKAGTGAFVIVGGEPGVGKSRLAEELAIRCIRDGFQTFVGHCYEMGAQPYIPIVEVFEQALAQADSPQAFCQFLGDEAPEVARLVPKLRRLCPDIPPALELPAEQERRYLFNSVWEVVVRAARSRPMLLILDDLHRTDEPTMLLIQHLAERITEAPVLILGLYRDSELEAGCPLSRGLEELTRRRLARRMRLEPLPREGVAQMLADLAGQEPPPRLADVIYAETEGNPFFTEEVFKHLVEEGRLFDAQGRFRADLSVDDLDVPEGVRLVVGARLRRLGEDGTKVLGSAAVLGRVFSFELLQVLEELPEVVLLDLVEDAERAGLILAIDEASGEDRFVFAHELIRQTVLSELSAPRRRRLHARAAEALERVYAASLQSQAAAIAHHLVQAGSAADPKRTFRYLLMAGQRALETVAFEDALTHLERAAERSELGTPSERAELLFRLGTARRNTGRWDEAVETWKEAVDAYELMGDPEAAGRICQEASYSLGWSSRWEEATAIGQRGIDLLGDEVSATRARLLAQQGNIMAYAGVPFEVGDALITRALALADELGDPAVRGHCLFGKAINRTAWMYLVECAEAGLEAAGLLRAANSLWEESAVLGFTQVALALTGQFAEARRVEAHLEPLAERLGNIGALLQCRRARGMVHFAETGDLDALEAFGRADLKLASDAGLPWVDSSYSWLGLARFLRGDWDGALGHFEQAAACEPPGALNGLDRALLVEFLAYSGDRERVLAMLDEGEDNRMPTPSQRNSWGRWAMLVSAVEGLFVSGERDRAGDYYDLVVECLERTEVVCANSADCRLLERAAGIAAMAGRCWDDAEGHFRTALRQAEELPHRPEAAHTRRFFAQMLLERDGPGDRAEATQLVNEAEALYRRMGMPKHLAMVETLSP
ncbi:MAG: AAA family ATPase [Actinomycetota bacterium]|nr:AAA family ATPase [Actinomycetota bacterium]